MQKRHGVTAVAFVVLVLAVGAFAVFGFSITGNTVEGSSTCGTYSSASPSSAQASASLSSGFDASKAIDGNADTRWIGSSTAAYPQWIYFDLGTKKCVKGVEVNLFNFSTPLTMDVQVSNDGQNWESVSSGWQITQEKVFVSKEFSEVRARYIRLYQTAGPAGTYGTAAEVKINSAPEVVPVVPSCSETDGGNVSETKGTTTLVNSSGSFPNEDVCTSDTQLKEYYCKGAEVASEIVACDGACTDKSCKRKIEQKVSTQIEDESKETTEEPAEKPAQQTPQTTVINSPEVGVISTEREVNTKCGEYSSVSPRDAVAVNQFHNFRAANAIDEDINSHWFGDPKESYPKWIYFDLGAKKCVKGTDVNVFLWDAPLKMDIQTSDNGQEWNTLASDWLIEEGGKFSTREFDEVQTRYIRLVETSGKRNYGTVSEVLVNSAPIEESVTERAKLFTQNVIGGPEPDEYYVIGGQNAYVKIDGKQVG